ncbi:GH92 family glycosyl hydrolase [Albibacterium sp.]|uniref:GH92 family glycosyl hydrolase n=1 Tax=Albibacterium sp. TaxID=2952885 RepID=UPI002BCA878B|nr:GH92 family glycosyl hydrolase [Albibacterium sp.]HUH17942.1 GH92 family glycosyl hydrolase [Albibacterium sp.]
MRYTLLYFIISLFVFNSSLAQEKLTSYVNPLIGTDGQGYTFPGAMVPFGMVQLSPDNGQTTTSPSGYLYSNTEIAGFSHMHLSGSNISEWLDISVMPLLNPLKDQDTIFKAASFSHQNEQASPGYYAVKLDNGIQVELTATERVGYHRYTFPAQANPTIRFDLAFHQGLDLPTETFIEKVNDSTIVGYRYSKGWSNNQRVYFAAKTSEPVKEVYLKSEINIEVGDISIGLKSNEEGEGVVSQLTFDHTEMPKTIELKVALSMTSTDKALLALNEIPEWNFNAIKNQADTKWERELEKIKITSNDLPLKHIFYTALYHTSLAPTLYSDVDGEYKNAQGDTIRMANGEMRYTSFNLEDTYSALNPLFTIIQPTRYTAMLNSILAFYDENGSLPVWDLGTSEVDTVAIFPSIPVLSDAILKDWPGLNAEKAYEAMRKSVLQRRDTLKFAKQYAFYDWSIGAVAKKLGRLSDFQQTFNLPRDTTFKSSLQGKPWETQVLVRQLFNANYRDGVNGYADKLSSAQTNAWIVWNAIGLYPANPVGGEYMIGSPLVDAATLQLKDGAKLEIEVINNSAVNKYVQSVKLNGLIYKKSYFSHKDLIHGGKITIQMGPEANLEWGSNKSWLPAFTSQPADVSSDKGAAKKDIFESISEFFKNLF